MKKTILILTAILFAFTTTVFSQEDTKQEKENEKITEVKLDCQMNCMKCANEVKKQLAFTKGVKFVEADPETDIVIVKYRNDKTDTDKIIASLAEIDYAASLQKKHCCPGKKTSCPGAKVQKASSVNSAKKSCCSENKEAESVKTVKTPCCKGGNN